MKLGEENQFLLTKSLPKSQWNLSEENGEENENIIELKFTVLRKSNKPSVVLLIIPKFRSTQNSQVQKLNNVE